MAHIPPPPPHLYSPAVQHSELRKLMSDPTGALADPFWRYVKARHDLNPPRFDRNHPTIGPILDSLERSTPAVIVSSPPSLVSSPAVIGPLPPFISPAMPITPIDHDHHHMPPGGPPCSPAIPGPNSALLLSLGILGAFLTARISCR